MSGQEVKDRRADEGEGYPDHPRAVVSQIKLTHYRRPSRVDFAASRRP